jgi:hypothetical protein
VGDLNTMEDDNNSRLNERIRDRTISTGAETPFSFALSNGFDLGTPLPIQTTSTASTNSSVRNNLSKSKK